MYFLNSDGTPDASNKVTESYCHCEMCRRKRKPKPCYNWFSWTNIIIFALLIGIILSFTVKSEQFERIRQKILMDEFMGETPSYAPSAPQLPSNKLKDIDFETALL
jgi:hypothetical protein